MKPKILILLLVGLSMVSADLHAQNSIMMKSNEAITDLIRQYWRIAGVDKYGGGFLNIEDQVFDFREIEFYETGKVTDPEQLHLKRQGDKVLITAKDAQMHFEVIELHGDALILDLYLKQDNEVKRWTRFSLIPRVEKQK